jgi:hypothetical protein
VIRSISTHRQPGFPHRTCTAAASPVKQQKQKTGISVNLQKSVSYIVKHVRSDRHPYTIHMVLVRDAPDIRPFFISGRIPNWSAGYPVGNPANVYSWSNDFLIFSSNQARKNLHTN